MDQNTDRHAFAQQYIDDLTGVLRALPTDTLAQAMELLEKALVERRQVFVAGNGGSASTASHMAVDLMKTVAKAGGRGLRVISLPDNVPIITAIANDNSYAEVFAGQLIELGQPGDVLIVISGSGNSPNIIRALEAARQMQISTIALLGMGGGKADRLADYPVIVPCDEYGPIEDVHLTINHLVTSYLGQYSASLRRRQA